jgi:hypothetical protein
VITSLSKESKIAQAQIRLMVQEMEEAGFEDSYGRDRQTQERLFIEIVKSFLNIPERIILKFL